jgi:hypothetical protein
MLLYNVTITIDKVVHEEWLSWMRTVHIADVMGTGLFISYRLNRLIGHEHEDSEIYTIQYSIKDMDTLVHYNEVFAPTLQARTKERFDGHYAAFRTVMEVIE